VALGVLRAGYNSGANNDGDFPLHAAARIAAVIGGRGGGGGGGGVYDIGLLLGPAPPLE
jgi:hypothetical protein